MLNLETRGFNVMGGMRDQATANDRLMPSVYVVPALAAAILPLVICYIVLIAARRRDLS